LRSHAFLLFVDPFPLTFPGCSCAPPMTSEPPSPSEPSGSADGDAAAVRGSTDRPTSGLTGTRPVPPALHHADPDPRGKRLAVLTFAALGVVYGDIGTSPLYAIKECFKPEYGLAPTAQNVLGVLSLIVWSLILVVSVKYVAFILRADNRGEGGVLALLALILKRQHRPEDARRRAIIIAIGLFGGAFLYGDGIITPAISVLGAMEGLQVAVPALGHFVVPFTFIIIAALFAVQRFGTAKVGGMFGWIMLVWFITIGSIGAAGVASNPGILRAINPWYGVVFFILHPLKSFIVLGAVVLVVTGGEALYADMGHFGRRPIRLAWFIFVLPALLLNYFGQGTLLLSTPGAVENPFYLLAPDWFRVPLLFIATSAAVVASQALISGAFSLTQQAVQLGFSPRMHIVHTSATEAGQIYIPEVNKALAVGTLLLVLGFQSSTALGAAYGVAVTGTMAITTILFYIIARTRWDWPQSRALAFLILFLGIDLAFFVANLLKIPHGGWVPLVVAAFVFTLMTTWARGRALLQVRLRAGSTMNMEEFITSLGGNPPHRVRGTAVFMTSDTDGVPVVLLHHLKHNKVLHETVILLSIVTEEVPEVPLGEKFRMEALGLGFHRVRASYGFMESPDVTQIMDACAREGLNTRFMETSYFLGRERLIPERTKKAPALPEGMKPLWLWRKKIFVFMSRNARSATEFFNIPPNRVVELGTQIIF
jgi:KUP system potassium uptake protein